jgi:hypothetical protein
MLMLSGIFNVASKEASRAGVVADKVMTKYGSDLVTDKEATQADKDKAAADDATFANGIK